MEILSKIISSVFIAFGGLLVLAGLLVLYEYVFEGRKILIGEIISPALLGVVFLSVGLRLKKRGTL